MKVYIVVKKPDYDEEIEVFQKPDYETYSLPNERAANSVMKAKGFDQYVAKHGYHFTEALAQIASDMMINKNGSPHKWTPQQVESYLKMNGYHDYKSCTLGDLTYLANMAYADFYPDVVRSEDACIRYAMAVAKDPDGYKGMVFSRWVSDLIGKDMSTIQWEKFI